MEKWKVLKTCLVVLLSNFIASSNQLRWIIIFREPITDKTPACTPEAQLERDEVLRSPKVPKASSFPVLHKSA